MASLLDIPNIVKWIAAASTCRYAPCRCLRGNSDHRFASASYNSVQQFRNDRLLFLYSIIAIMSDSTSLPASLTKHLDYLAHPLPRQVSTRASLTHPVELQQRSAAGSETTGTGTTGTTLWLGAQLMAAYLAETLGYVDGQQSSKQVIELGGGVGYLG